MKSWVHVAMLVSAIGLIPRADDSARPPNDAAPRFSRVHAGRYIVELRGNDVASLRAAVSALGGNVEFAHAEAGIATVSGLTADAAAELAAVNAVGAVHEDVAIQIAPEAASIGTALAASQFSPASPANALLYAWQWSMRRVGADVAWAAGRLGSPDVTVAIIDSGIDSENADLAGRVDLNRSRSFVPGDDALMNTWLPTYPKSEDLSGHGSQVASLVASNGVFFAGVTSHVTLLAIKAFGYENFAFFSTILRSVLYAADQGADVANMSMRFQHGLDKRDPNSLFSATNAVFNYAYRKGMVVVLVPGNEAEDMDHDGPIFRAYCDAPHVICVSATGPTASASPFTGPWQNEDAFAPYSNYGKAIALSAPGGTPRGPIWSLCARHRVTGFVPNTNPAQPIFACLTPTPDDGFVTPAWGTSLAAPHVSALAALLVENLGKNNPSRIKQALLRGVDDLGEPGHDPLFGAGRINIPRTLSLR